MANVEDELQHDGYEGTSMADAAVDDEAVEGVVTRIDFSSEDSDGVMRISFDDVPGDDSDSVIRLDLSEPAKEPVQQVEQVAQEQLEPETPSGDVDPAGASPDASAAATQAELPYQPEPQPVQRYQPVQQVIQDQPVQQYQQPQPVQQFQQYQPALQVFATPYPEQTVPSGMFTPMPVADSVAASASATTAYASSPQPQAAYAPSSQPQIAYPSPSPSIAPSPASTFAPTSGLQPNPVSASDEEKAADRAQAANRPSPEEVAAAKNGLERIIANVETVVIGKREPVSLVVLALVARGHVLLEDLPGTGKTTLVSALARSIACDFSRIQFTPDIMPSDVSGFSIYNQKTNDFEFRPGGVMSNLVLADEINRASAKTQSALLEAMEERQVTVDGQTYRLPEPFMVLATQNPIEQFGTYPLPEAQVDRFLVKLSMGYPGFDQEVHVLELGDRAKKALAPAVSGQDILALRAISNRVYASRIVVRYIVEIISATRDNPEVQVGSSPRGGIALLALARAYALLQGRAYVIPDDVKYLAPHVLCHRVSLAHEAKVAGRTERQVIESILSGIAVPYYDETEAQGLR